MEHQLSLVPLPMELTPGDGTLTIERKLDVVAADPAREAAVYLGGLLERHGGTTVRYLNGDPRGSAGVERPSGTPSLVQESRG